jgi:DNA-binding MarR family transcriptional regulator
MSNQSVSEVTSLVRAIAAFGAANDAVDAAVAKVLGVNRTDLAILGVIQSAGRATASSVSHAVGLSASATTTALDRLAAAGYVTRAVDPADRRRVELRTTELANRRTRELYGPLEQDGAKLLAGLSPEQVATIERFLSVSVEHMTAHAARIRSAQ